MNLSKIHLSKLPNLTTDQVPPRPNSVSKKGIVLLPLFKNREIIAHHVGFVRVGRIGLG